MHRIVNNTTHTHNRHSYTQYLVYEIALKAKGIRKSIIDCRKNSNHVEAFKFLTLCLLYVQNFSNGSSQLLLFMATVSWKESKKSRKTYEWVVSNNSQTLARGTHSQCRNNYTTSHKSQHKRKTKEKWKKFFLVVWEQSLLLFSLKCF